VLLPLLCSETLSVFTDAFNNNDNNYNNNICLLFNTRMYNAGKHTKSLFNFQARSGNAAISLGTVWNYHYETHISNVSIID